MGRDSGILGYWVGDFVCRAVGGARAGLLHIGGTLRRGLIRVEQVVRRRRIRIAYFRLRWIGLSRGSCCVT